MPKFEDVEKTEIYSELKPEKASSLGPTFLCTGQISGQEDLLIKGTFKGTIRIKNHSLFIEKSARVEADIVAANVMLSGDLTGNIQATGKVFLSSEAKMKGDITAAKISVQDGAQFRGAIRMEKSGS
ncbi:MAG: polymer-forming cytoskeletal protein [Candidatus Aminicenantes bacterium]|jgi:cytoskeletal protein CcmA (bactofilin family)|nr:polymer-forming cytoskeletal protein [Candidatus Aminicenantes bacterium]